VLVAVETVAGFAETTCEPSMVELGTKMASLLVLTVVFSDGGLKTRQTE